jgi:hypothetical protein
MTPALRRSVSSVTWIELVLSGGANANHTFDSKHTQLIELASTSPYRQAEVQLVFHNLPGVTLLFIVSFFFFFITSARSTLYAVVRSRPSIRDFPDGRK